MGETVRYVAHHRGRWLALLVFSAPALKCGARDRWTGWDRGGPFGRLDRVTTNALFLILPGGERNLGSRVLSAVHAPSGQRLACLLRSRRAPGGALRRPRALPGHRLPRRQLDRGRAHPQLRLRWGPAIARTRGPGSCSFIPCAEARGPGLGPSISTSACDMECRR